MIIHKPLLTETDEDYTVSSKIEFASSLKNETSILWYKFKKNKKYIPSTEIDPFLISLLLLAMQKNENIEVLSPVSSLFLQNIDLYQNRFNEWYPDRFYKIKIKAEVRSNEDKNLNQRKLSATAFSGGVDSFYTFFSLLEDRAQNLNVALFMSGFDMPINLVQSISELTDHYQNLMKEKNIDFIVGSTNVRNFVNTVDWTNAHGQALAASALFFKNQITTFFIPGSYTLPHYPKWGTHPELDPLLSTEELKFHHHGANVNRVQKLKKIIRYPESYKGLRVCWIQDIGLKNCGKCEKCVRTKTALLILGCLDQYQTFSNDSSVIDQIKNLAHRTYQGRLFAKELVIEALKRRKIKVALVLGYSLFDHKKKYQKKKNEKARTKVS